MASFIHAVIAGVISIVTAAAGAHVIRLSSQTTGKPKKPNTVNYPRYPEDLEGM